MQIVFRDADQVRHVPPGDGEVCLWPGQDLGRVELASLVLRGELQVLRCGQGPPALVVAPADPTLDDMLAATIVTARLEHREVPAGVAAFARYAALVREGLFPGKAPFESSPEGVYLAIRRDPGDRDLTHPPAAARFLADWSRLERAILDAAAQGLSPMKDDFLSDDGEFERERAFLRRDHEVYQLDVARGEQWEAHLPGGPPDGQALVLREPRSILFKRWHRMPPVGGGKRCVLLAVQESRGRWVFSTDPVFRLSLKPLADRLQGLEMAVDPRRAPLDPWFDGARFAHSMIAAPHGGTKLRDEQVLQAVRDWAQAPAAAPADSGEPTDIGALVDLHADEFERQWKTGQRPDVGQYVMRVPDEARAHLLHECILMDLEYRVRLGEDPKLEEYERKHPQFSVMIRLLRPQWDEAVARLQSGAQTRVMGPTGPSRQPAGAPKPLTGGTKPRKIRRYVIIEKLPKSGQAELYRAVDPELRREVLIKWYFRCDGDADASDRAFQNEASILAQLNHPNLARIFGLDRFKRRPFLVMEYINGMNLRQYASARPLAPQRSARLVAQVARALAYVHARAVFHYDIKPENILVDRAGRARLIDFGWRRYRSAWNEPRDAEGEIFGTAGYMSPEQANANPQPQRLGPASDTFALGGVLYFLLTGKDPFTAPTLNARLELARKCEWGRAALASADVPEAFKQVCTKALSAASEDRYTATALAAALSKLARVKAG